MAISNIVVQVTDKGISAPTYNEIVDYLKEQYKAIYGDDVYFGNDSQDGQWIGVQAKAIHDCNTSAVDVYNSFSPNTAKHDALVRNVKINGIRLQNSSKSSVVLKVIGVAGTNIKSGVVTDKNGNKWFLPDTTIGSTGEALVTATAEKEGAISALPNTVTTITTPTRGWQSVTNPQGANLGAAIETDTKLRQRQSASVAIGSTSLEEGLRGAILSLEGVSRCRTFTNSTRVKDANEIPPNSLCVMVYGGDSTEIATLIKVKKSMGCGLYGNTQVTLLNIYDEPEIISFYRANVENISYLININTNDSYSADTAEYMKSLLADYTNDLGIGDKITLNKIVGVANLYGAEQSRTYELVKINIKADGQIIEGDYTLPFGSVAFCDPSLIEVQVTNG